MPHDDPGDYFVTDVDDDFDDDDLLAPPIVVPGKAQGDDRAPSPPTAIGEPAGTGPAEAPAERSTPETEARPEATDSVPEQMPAAPQAPPQGAARPQVEAVAQSREQRLARALDGLMASNLDIQAAALVSMDGFTMASALPEGMQEDRVGAMSAAILGLGERAATELGRGGLEQVFIEGDDGIVVLVSAGGRAVLTALAGAQARLGLVIFDMRAAAEEIGRILG
jgi:predicted regulator of Ras-like GTPase activity (Roadblock/LC7/MglB family)